MPSESRDSLIEAAVRPFSVDAELRAAAASLLETLVTGPAEEAADATARWDAVDESKRRPVWRWLLFAVWVIVSTVIWTDGVKALLNGKKGVGVNITTDIFYSDPGPSSGKVARNLTDRQRLLLLYADSPAGSESAQAKALWDSDPANPAYFAEYVNVHLAKNGGTLPPNFLETARRIDPQNAWFTYVAAGVRAKDAVRRKQQSKAEIAANKTPEWDILDPTKLADALVILRHARNQPRCESYELEVLRQQLQLMPGRTPPEVMRQLLVVFGRSNDAEITLRVLAEGVAAQAWLDGQNNDLPGLRERVVDADGFLQKLTRSEVGSLLAELINQFSVSTILSNLSPAADQLGFTKESGRLKDILERVEEMKARKGSKKKSPNRDLIYKKSSEFAGMLSASASSSLKNPPILTDEELRPGRLIDHEVLSRVCCYLTWVVLVVAMGVAAASRFRSPILIRRLAGRLESLMRPADWAWMVGGGVLLPFCYVMAVTRLTPWGGRELSLSYSCPSFYSYNEPLEFSQFIGLAALMILLPVRIARWRQEKRAAVFGFRRKWRWLGWTAIVCAFAFVPMLGWAVTRPSESGVYVAFYVAAVPVFWLLATGIRSLYPSPENLLHDGVIARMLVPTYALAALLMMASVPYFKSAAYHWFEQDEFMKTELAHPTFPKFEYKISVQMRKETREILGDER